MRFFPGYWAELLRASRLACAFFVACDTLPIEARPRVAFVCGGRARPIPKPLGIAMKAEQDRAGTAREACFRQAALRRLCCST